MFAKEFVLNSCPPKNRRNKYAGRDEREPRANSDRAGGNGDAHGQITGMANESIRASSNEVMSALALNTQRRRKEGIPDHRPCLQGTAQDEQQEVKPSDLERHPQHVKSANRKCCRAHGKQKQGSCHSSQMRRYSVGGCGGSLAS